MPKRGVSIMPDGGAREWPWGMPHHHAPLEWGHYGEADWGLSAWCTCGVLVDTGLLFGRLLGSVYPDTPV